MSFHSLVNVIFWGKAEACYVCRKNVFYSTHCSIHLLLVVVELVPAFVCPFSSYLCSFYIPKEELWFQFPQVCLADIPQWAVVQLSQLQTVIFWALIAYLVSCALCELAKMWLIISEADRAPAYLTLFNVLICSQAFQGVVMKVQGLLALYSLRVW